MSIDKSRNEIPQWLRKVGEKMEQQKGGEKNSFLSDAELSDVWSRIEETLDAKKRKALFIPWTRVLSYAAGVLFLLAVGIGVFRITTTDDRIVDSPNPSQSVAQLPPATTHEEKASKPIENEAPQEIQFARHSSAEAISMKDSEESSVPPAQEIITNELITKEDATCNTEEPQPTKESPLPSSELPLLDESQVNNAKNSSSSNSDATVVTVEKLPHFEQEILYALGGEREKEKLSRITFASQSSVFSGYSSAVATPNSSGLLFSKQTSQLSRKSYLEADDAQNLTKNSLLRYDQASFSHRVPLSIGGKVSFALIPKLSIETGIRYSLLTSKVSNYDPTRRLTQQIHYLGIPIAVNMELYRYQRLSFYAGVELGIDKVISSKLDGKNLGLHPWQFSLGAGAGISFSILPQLSLYVSPGVSYYFNDGTILNTYYKEHPLNFSFSMGIRVTPFVDW